MARASSIRQLARSRPSNFLSSPSDPGNTTILGLHRSLNLVTKCRATRQLFQVHARLITSGHFRNPSWAIRLLKGSSRFGDLSYTVSIFRCIGEPYCVNTIIKAYSVCFAPQLAVGFYFEMLRCSFVPDSYTFVSLFGSIGKMGSLDSGKMCHGQTVKNGFDQVLPVQNSLIHMYACCGVLELANKVFVEMSKRDIVSWNSRIDGSVRNGDLGFAHNLFDAMPERNVVSWNIMISAYLDAGNPGFSMKLFRKMVGAGFQGNGRTMVLVLTACGRSARLKEGRSVHASSIKTLLNSNIIIDTALIDMYCKCKEVELARKIFDNVSCRNVITWNAMILGHCLHGNPEEGLNLFAGMVNQSSFRKGDAMLMPDEVTFVGVLCACARAGLLAEGANYYTQMVDAIRIKPNFGHLWCMANLYSSVGLAQEAAEMLKTVTEEEGSPESAIWANLLSSCRFKGNVAFGESIAKSLIEMEPQNYSYYRLLMNVYTVAGRRKDVERVKEMVKERRIGRMPGCGLVDLKEIVHDLRLGQEETEQVYSVINEFTQAES